MWREAGCVWSVCRPRCSLSRRSPRACGHAPSRVSVGFSVGGRVLWGLSGANSSGPTRGHGTSCPHFTDEQRASESEPDGPSSVPSHPGALPARLTCLVCFQGPWRAEVAVPLLGPRPEAAHWTRRSQASWWTLSPAPRGSQVARWSRGAWTWAAPARPFGKTWTASSLTCLPSRRQGFGQVQGGVPGVGLSMDARASPGVLCWGTCRACAPIPARPAGP